MKDDLSLFISKSQDVYPTPSETLSFVIKASGGMRLVTDFIQLNKAVRRPIHPIASVKDITQLLDKTAKYFVKLNILGGYW